MKWASVSVRDGLPKRSPTAKSSKKSCFTTPESPRAPEHLLDRGRILRLKQRGTKPRAARQARRVPGEVLFDLNEGVARRQVRLDQRAVPADDARALVTTWRFAREDPRRSEGAAPDHDGGAARRRGEGTRVGMTPHVTVTDHGNAHRCDDLADDLPRCSPQVLLRSRARVDGDRVDALTLGDVRDLDRVDGALVPARADLDRERHADSLAQRPEEHGGAQRIAHERGALALGDDLRHRTAHVEVDRVGAD